MSSFTKPLRIEYMNGKMFKLIESFEYHVGNENSLEIIIVPEGFITDFASIPRLFWTLIGSPAGEYGKAAVIHDYLYSTQQYSRKKSDFIFYEAMGVLNVSTWKRWIMYKYVRFLGWFPWNKYKNRRVLNVNLS